MPKIKTHRGAAKRFSATGSGKLKRNKAFHRHILTKKSPKQKNNSLGTCLMDDADHRAVRQMLPYL
ncbi:MAG: 50S ribosomal protein L35 [Magnetococcales bacterium]|nr:50S ribosomal protein L35 [Magnetococcales bacterium]MBF0296525.1 50S ribosomal protein L35 [Magnetococcales bacterium]